MTYQGENTVPLGEAGTGAAYLLPQSQAIANIGNYLDDQDKQQQQANALKLKQAQDLAKSWKDNQLKIKGGTLYQPEINSRTAQVMQMGLDLQKAGVNPNMVSTNPKAQALLEKYQTQKAALLDDVDTRDKITTASQANEKALAAQPAGYYDPQSVNDYHDYISGKIPLSQITSQGIQMPELKKAFNLQPLVDKIPGVPIETTGTNPHTGVKTKMILPNEDAHAQLATGLVNNNPEVQADISKKAGMPYTQIGTETDPAVIKQNIDDFWRSGPNIPKLAGMGINSYDSPQYDQMITQQAKQMANAAKVKNDYTNGIKTQLDNKVHRSDDKSWDFAYQNEQDRRERLGMERERFADWKSKQQDEAGAFSLGNQDSYVPVIKSNQPKDGGKQGQSFVEPEKGASLYGVNLPQVETVVKPSYVTDTRTGKTTKNTDPISVKVSQIQMVPVFKDLSDNDPRNGSEISARQLKEIVSGKHAFADLKNVTFQPYAYGVSSVKDKANVHTINTPIKFSYDALKGSNVKKINTATFDEATDGLKALQSNPKFRSMSPQDQLDFISQRYHLKLEQ